MSMPGGKLRELEKRANSKKFGRFAEASFLCPNMS